MTDKAREIFESWWMQFQSSPADWSDGDEGWDAGYANPFAACAFAAWQKQQETINSLQSALAAKDAEIERLREALARSRHYHDGDVIEMTHQIEQQAAEIERLTYERDVFAESINEQSVPCLPSCDSIAHDEFCPHVNTKAAYLHAVKQIEQLQARVKELENGLRDIKAGKDNPCYIVDKLINHPGG